MQTRDLARIIWILDPDTPKHRKLERLLKIGAEYGNPWYSSQKEHWLGWLGDYHTSGAYNRKQKSPTDARSVYNRINCAPMLFWLCEASGVPDPELSKAFDAVAKLATARVASQCGALRRVIPWADVETQLMRHADIPDVRLVEADEAISAARAKLREKLKLPST